MNDTTRHPAALVEALETIGLTDLFDGFVARTRVGVRYLEIERAAGLYGYAFQHRDGNVYGKVRLVPITPSNVPVMRFVTRSDHAAVHGGRKQAA